ncbi:hypothetical protein [Paraburkholderia humisilvae]|uniref:hypothetical protein n=1 Tax=Paraburkholderia humisilvae TaxID=627669 RepID=UPI0015821916|nr:hypothetical protein [Paraburkholderia humisilvae]
MQIFAHELLAEDVSEALFDLATDDSALQVVQELRVASGKARTGVEGAAIDLSINHDVTTRLPESSTRR